MSQFNCPEKYYKCPQYYCVRYKFLCDGKWDCPAGHDESKMLCTDRKCQGQFKCHNSTICISIQSICDGILDCPFGDDIYFCFPPIPLCPKNCTCQLYSMSIRQASTFCRTFHLMEVTELVIIIKWASRNLITEVF